MMAIQTRNLCKDYGSNVGLKNLNINIKSGEVYGFIGKNGAGKTTTINLLLSLINKTSGEILIKGKKVSYTDIDYKKHIGYVPDVPVFPTHMTAKEYLVFVCEIFKISKEQIENKVNEILNFVGLEKTNNKVVNYSRGMKQRLAIGQALIHDPDIIIMDEPTSALDPTGRKEVMDIIMRLKGKKTIFYSTHILDDVEKVCDRIGLLDNGELILEDEIDVIKAKYFKDSVYIETAMKQKELIAFLNKKGFQDVIKPEKKGIVCMQNGGRTGEKILKELLKAEVELIQYKEERASLEDIFMGVTS